MGLIDFNYFAESTSKNTDWGSIADWAGVTIAFLGVAAAGVAAHFARKAFIQTQQIARDGHRPLLHSKFKVTSQGLAVTLVNKGLGPLLLTNQVELELNGDCLIWNNLITQINNQILQPLDIAVDFPKSRRTRLGIGDAIAVNESIVILSIHFAEPLEYGVLTTLKTHLRDSQFAVIANYQSIHHINEPNFRREYGQIHPVN